VVPAANISSTVFNLASVVVLSMGISVGIIMGQLQGAGTSREELWESKRKLTGMTVIAGIVFGGLLAAISGLFPMLYDATDSVRTLATRLICIAALMLPFRNKVATPPLRFTIILASPLVQSVAGIDKPSASAQDAQLAAGRVVWTIRTFLGPTTTKRCELRIWQHRTPMPQLPSPARGATGQPSLCGPWTDTARDAFAKHRSKGV
jgi:hypothetical protein